MQQKTIDLYHEMAKLTESRCGTSSCGSFEKRPNRCCDPAYCEVATDYMAEQNAPSIAPTGHPTLRYMGEKGCVVPPEYRPLCTLHDCKINSIGCDPKDAQFTEKYFDLRANLNDAMFDDLLSE